jgi:hypothetical protein
MPHRARWPLGADAVPGGVVLGALHGDSGRTSDGDGHLDLGHASNGEGCTGTGSGGGALEGGAGQCRHRAVVRGVPNLVVVNNHQLVAVVGDRQAREGQDVARDRYACRLIEPVEDVLVRDVRDEVEAL